MHLVFCSGVESNELREKDDVRRRGRWGMEIDITRTMRELTETRLPKPDVMGRPLFPHAELRY